MRIGNIRRAAGAVDAAGWAGAMDKAARAPDRLAGAPDRRGGRVGLAASPDSEAA